MSTYSDMRRTADEAVEAAGGFLELARAAVPPEDVERYAAAARHAADAALKLVQGAKTLQRPASYSRERS